MSSNVSSEEESTALADSKKVTPELSVLSEEPIVVEEANKINSKRARGHSEQAARRLAARGEMLIIQDGKVTDLSFVKASWS